jgi:DNA-binding NtrC family response regulator
MALTILIVEPEEPLRESVRESLRSEGHRVWAFASADNAVDALDASTSGKPQLAFLTAGEDTGMERLINHLRTGEGRCQQVWIAPAGDSEVDRLAVQRKPRGLLARTGLSSQACILADRVWRTHERSRALSSPPPMLGESEAIRGVASLVDRIAAGGAGTVLITGESGTGKEVVARHLHAAGQRAQGPFVEVDCASIPANLLESELFGHEPGAFTDARTTKIGLLELAQGGTAFLDEIGELDLGLQAKLLRVLDTRRMRRLGGRDEIPLDVHLVAATNRNLNAEVRAGHFRADLFYRLDVVRVELPPVRVREDDAWLLASVFLEEAGRRLGRGPLQLDPALRDELLGYHWPGNVREIKNHMERLALSCDADDRTVRQLLLPALNLDAPSRLYIDFSAGPLAWESIERHVLEQALRTADGNVSEAARLLELGRGALRYRLSRHGINLGDDFEEEQRAA